MSDSGLDLTDPYVLNMADRNHTPEEMWTINGELIGVNCEMCNIIWPCPTRVAVDKVRRERLARIGDQGYRKSPIWTTEAQLREELGEQHG